MPFTLALGLLVLIVNRQQSRVAEEQALQLATKVAEHSAAQVKAQLDEAITPVRTLAAASTSGEPPRSRTCASRRTDAPPAAPELKFPPLGKAYWDFDSFMKQMQGLDKPWLDKP